MSRISPSLVFVSALAALSACEGGEAQPDPAPEARAEAPKDAEADEEAPAPEAAPTEAKAKFAAVDVPNDAPDLAAALAAEAKKASEAGLRPHVEFWASWCGPCKELEGSMSDERMQEAFAGIYLIKLDADQWGDKLEGTGMSASSIPAFWELDAEGKATGRSITGGAWAENIPENMAPPLKAYFAGEKS